MTASPRWVWPCALGWLALIGVIPWVMRWVWGDALDSGQPVMEYAACVAASAFVLGAALGRVRAWAPCVAAGVVGGPVMPAASGAFDEPAGGIGDISGFAVMGAFMLVPLILLSLLIGACVGSLVGSLREG